MTKLEQPHTYKAQGLYPYRQAIHGQ